ncbi:MAG: carboxypeptidase M32 [Bacillota bacterium]|nr:carboxypeptidase M32 [Bacillota bacterium]
MGQEEEEAVRGKLEQLKQVLAEVEDLEMATAVLYWDQQTQMPRGGAAARADQVTTLRRLAHEKFTSPEVGELLDALADHERALPYDSDDASILRVTRREYSHATKLPRDLVVEMSRAAAEAYHKWVDARQAKDFGIFVSSLERIVTLSREKAQALGYENEPLDALIDLSEPGFGAAELDRLFAELRETLVPLAKAIGERSDRVSDALFRQRFDVEKQLEMGRAAVRAIGFNLDDRGRQALSVHPFSISFTPDDTRITTRVNEQWLGPSLFGLLHEAGHGTYMQGIPVRYRRTPLHNGASSGLHESQSRLWENYVGRSRAFWRFFLPVAKAFFPGQLGRATVDEVYAAANIVKPSLIRVEADEVTYNLHIMIRFELEREVFAGRLAVADLPAAWNAKFQAYLGITPPDDLVGVLQDIHWTQSFGGSFQSYTIGNVASVALCRRALADHLGMEDEWAKGDFSGLLTWMQDNVHAHGAKYKPNELLLKVTGEELTPRPYLEHIKAKYTEIYRL